jgi:hypothetical protein
MANRLDTKQPNKSVFSWSQKKCPKSVDLEFLSTKLSIPIRKWLENQWGASHMPSHAWLPLGLPEFMAHFLHPIAHMLHLWGGASRACGVDQPKTADVSILLNWWTEDPLLFMKNAHILVAGYNTFLLPLLPLLLFKSAFLRTIPMFALQTLPLRH